MPHPQSVVQPELPEENTEEPSQQEGTQEEVVAEGATTQEPTLPRVSSSGASASKSDGDQQLQSDQEAGRRYPVRERHPPNRLM